MNNDRRRKTTADLLYTGLPSHSVIQSFIDEHDDTKLELHIRRWDRDYLSGWEGSYNLSMKDKDGNLIADNVFVPESTKANIIIKGVQCLRKPPVTKKFEGNIPMNFFQTSAHKFTDKPNYSGIINNLHEINRLLQWNFDYKCLSDKEAISEIESSGDQKLVKAYHALISHSFKADVLRYYLLYKYGGIYMDDKALLRYPLDTNIFADILEYSDMVLIGTKSCLMPEIAFLATRPGSKILHEVLQRVITNIENRFYGDSPFEITGNKCFQHVLEEKSRHVEGNWYKCFGERLYFFERKLHQETLFVNGDIHWLQFVVPWTQTSKWGDPNYYVNLHYKRKIYTDGNDLCPEKYEIRRFCFPSEQLVVVLFSLIFSLSILFYLCRLLLKPTRNSVSYFINSK